MPIEFRVNTQQAYIPLLSSWVGPNVLQSSARDKQFVVRSNYVGSTQIDKDIGIPMLLYAENVLPTSQGFQSIGFKDKIPPLPGELFDSAIPLRMGRENNILLSPSEGKNFVSRNNYWISNALPNRRSGIVTVAYSTLRSFIFYQRQEAYEYDETTNSIVGVTLNGLDEKNIDGITAANNLVIAWNDTTIFWSSTIDPTDFVPSLSSGAGSENPSPVRGKIVACLPVADGFIIYTTANAVYAAWSGNIRFPWTFTEIKGSAGITNPDHVTYESNYDGHFAWTTDGLQMVTQSGAKMFFPELTDFLTAKKVEEFVGVNKDSQRFYNEASVQFNSQSQDWGSRPAKEAILQEFTLTEQPWIKLALVGSRFLIISYGYRARRVFDYAIVYDLALQRFGKLKISHVDAFHYYHQVNETVQAKEAIAFLYQDGRVQIADFASTANDFGVFIFGKIKDVQGRGLELLEYDISIDGPYSVKSFALVSYDDTNHIYPKESMELIKARNYSRYGCHVSGSSLGLCVTGTFSITSMRFEVNIGGDR